MIDSGAGASVFSDVDMFVRIQPLTHITAVDSGKQKLCLSMVWAQ